VPPYYYHGGNPYLQTPYEYKKLPEEENLVTAPSEETKKEGPESTPAQQEKGRISKSSSPAVAAPASSKSTLDRIASGTILLNPAVPRDAKMIQKRLDELGFYRGTIDGIWGQGSRAALKAFKEKNSLGNSDKWDKETQKLLFQK